MSGSTCRGVRVRQGDGFLELPAQAVVLACGGFESNPELRLRYLGEGWDLVKVRGTRFNMGTMLDAGPGRRGGARRPLGRGPRLPPRRPRPRRGRPVADRSDEPLLLPVRPAGEPGRGALRRRGRGRGVADLRQDRLGDPPPAGARAWQLFDQRTLHLLEPRYSTGVPVEADSLDGLAAKLGIAAGAAGRDGRGLQRGVRRARRAAAAAAAFDPFHKDGLRHAAGCGRPSRTGRCRSTRRPSSPTR